MNAVWIVAALAGGCIFGYLVCVAVAKATGSRVAAENEKLKRDAQKEADQILREARVTAKADVVKLKEAFEDEVRDRRREQLSAEKRLAQKEENINNFAQRLAQQGIDVDTYLSYMGTDKEAFESSMREQAVSQVKLGLALDKIAEDEKIEVSAEDIEEEFKKLAEMYGMEVEKIKSLIAEDLLKADLLKEKVVKFVVDNAKALAEALQNQGFHLVSGGTDNHLMLIDLRDEECTGKELEARLDSVHITANKNTVPGETRSPFVTSGVRLGTPAVTTRGMGVAEMKVIADCIADCIWHYDEKKDEISDRVLKLTRDFPLYQ